jgi:hypothetical protein
LAGLPGILNHGILVNICCEHTWKSAKLQPNICHQLHFNKEKICLPMYVDANIRNPSQGSCNCCILNLLSIKRIVILHRLELIFFISSSGRFIGAIPGLN